jgi:hypothetical protein
MKPCCFGSTGLSHVQTSLGESCQERDPLKEPGGLAGVSEPIVRQGYAKTPPTWVVTDRRSHTAVSGSWEAKANYRPNANLSVNGKARQLKLLVDKQEALVNAEIITLTLDFSDIQVFGGPDGKT